MLGNTKGTTQQPKDSVSLAVLTAAAQEQINEVPALAKSRCDTALTQ